MTAVRLHTATTRAELHAVRRLFSAYAEELGVDLCFQGFDAELAELPGRYGPPRGRLVVGYDGDEAIACVGLRDLGDGVSEIKRMYVAPAHRGARLGRRLATMMIADARALGYAKVRLDTLATLTPALQLYGSLGFRRIDAYYANPHADVVYLELDLIRSA